MDLKILDLFSGIGGFSYAAERIVGGYKTTQFVEIDPYCQSVLRKKFPTSLFTMTSKHSQQNKDNSMFSQLDFRAKIYPSQDDNVVSEKVQDQDYSTKVSGYLGKFDLDSPSLKMLEIYSPLKKGGYSKESSFKLPKQGIMKSNGQLFQQKIWEPATSVKDCGSLPTPTASDVEGGIAKDVQYKNGHFYRENKKGERWGVKLRDAVTLLPTPTTMDHLPQRGYESMVKQTQIHRKGRKISKSQRSSKPRDSGIIQQTPKWRDTKYKLDPNWERYASEPRLLRGDDGLSNQLDSIKALGNSIVPNCSAIPLQRIKRFN